MAKTTSFVVTEQNRTMIASLVASGRYTTASEVIRAALDAFGAEVEKERVCTALIQEGLDALARGEEIDGAEVFLQAARRRK